MMTPELDSEHGEFLDQQPRAIEGVSGELIIFELYNRGEIVGVKAANLLGMESYAFIRTAANLGIPYFTLTPEELDAEVQFLQSVR